MKMNKPKVRRDTRKKLDIYKSGRSSDFITPSFGVGCLYNCAYCYMHRHGRDFVSIAKNAGDILTAVNNHVAWLPEKMEAIDKARGKERKSLEQTSVLYWTYDISCNEDFALHAKYHDWKRIFQFFVDHPKLMGTFATKHIPRKFLDFNPKRKIRIRFSLMPQRLSRILEPETNSIIDRIQAIKSFRKAGYDVHVNFSPVIIYKGWMDDYVHLFRVINEIVTDEDKPYVKAEVIFLTHSRDMHKRNLGLGKGLEEHYLWNPSIQEDKISDLGGQAIRYKRGFKKDNVNFFKTMMQKIIPWMEIRYIF